MRNNRLRVLSMFANVGIAECYVTDLDIEICVANEIENDRANMYTHLYPDTEMINGDIKDISVYDEVITKCKSKKVNMIIATPPCQGMSTAGKKDKNDTRNNLICYAVKAIKDLLPEYVLLENVPEQLNTEILYNDKMIKIPDYLNIELGNKYVFSNKNIVNAADYGVPQLRERAIILLTRKDRNKQWNMPEPSGRRISMYEAIGELPSLDPEIYDISYKEMVSIFPLFEKKKQAGLKVSKWHYPPRHVLRQVLAMMHTPTGKSAFENIDKFKPLKSNGEVVRGYKNTYKRQNWESPAYTITMYNRTIGSQNNVHPGNNIGKDDEGNNIYSDARVLSIFELMKIMTIPDDWDVPEWASDNFIRSVIGEGIPPLMMKKILEVIPDEM